MNHKLHVVSLNFFPSVGDIKIFLSPVTEHVEAPCEVQCPLDAVWRPFGPTGLSFLCIKTDVEDFQADHFMISREVSHYFKYLKFELS